MLSGFRLSNPPLHSASAMPNLLSISRSAKNDTEGVTNRIESENFSQQLAAQLTRLFHVESKESRFFKEIIQREHTEAHSKCQKIKELYLVWFEICVFLGAIFRVLNTNINSSRRFVLF